MTSQRWSRRLEGRVCMGLTLFLMIGTTVVAAEEILDEEGEPFGSARSEKGPFDVEEAEVLEGTIGEYDWLLTTDSKQPGTDWYLLEAPEGRKAAESGQSALATKETPSPESSSVYRIKPGDQLSISIYKVSDMTREVLVRPDGRISYPLVGELEVVGKTLLELREILRDRLVKYIRQPEINVDLIRISSQRVIVLGEVNSPGIYQFGGGSSISLAEVMALAKGYRTSAHLKSVMVVPSDFSKAEEVKRVNFHAYLKHHRPMENPLIPAGSLVYVPRSFIGSINQFVADVAGPAYRVGLSSREGHFAWKEITD